MKTCPFLSVVFAFSLAATSSLWAQAPIPRALIEARTAYLVNEGAGQGQFEALAKALQQWGRFTLVDDVTQSDITITLGGLQAFRGWPLTITKSADHTPLWFDKQKKHGFTGNVADPLVKNLRQRLEGSKRIDTRPGEKAP